MARACRPEAVPRFVLWLLPALLRLPARGALPLVGGDTVAPCMLHGKASCGPAPAAGDGKPPKGSIEYETGKQTEKLKRDIANAESSNDSAASDLKWERLERLLGASKKWLAQKRRAKGVLRRGEGAYLPDKDAEVEVHYEGATHDGNIFDSTRLRPLTAGTSAPAGRRDEETGEKGQPATISLAAPGRRRARLRSRRMYAAREGLQLMVEGDKWLFYIPKVGRPRAQRRHRAPRARASRPIHQCELAYGRESKGDGDIPGGPGDALLFTVDLLRIVSGKVMTKEETERL
eukprot:gene48376-1750_t